MKLLLTFLLLWPASVYADFSFYDGGVIRLFSLKDPCGYYKPVGKEWVMRTIEIVGSTDCAHSWVYSDTYNPKAGMGCVIYHGGHCDWEDRWQDKICEKCGRLEKLEEIWNEEYIPCPEPQKSEFEILRDSFTKTKTK